MHVLRAAFSAAFLLLPALAAGHRGVLILHSYQRPIPAGLIVDNTLRDVIREGFMARANVFSEFLDVEWYDAGPSHAARQAALLEEKYRERNIRVIVASGPYALQFVTEFRGRMLTGVPVVHALVDREFLDRIAQADYVGKTLDLDPTPTLQLALRLHPDAKRLLIVLGGNTTTRDRLWERLVRLAVSRLEGRLDVEYLIGLPTTDLLRQLGELSHGTIIFTPGFSPDPEGGSTVTQPPASPTLPQCRSTPPSIPTSAPASSAVSDALSRSRRRKQVQSWCSS